MTTKEEIRRLEKSLGHGGLLNDCVYWDTCRTYGEYSDEVLNHLISRARAAGIIDEDEEDIIRDDREWEGM